MIKFRLLPSRALAITLIAQIPCIAAYWQPEATLSSVLAGGVALSTGVILNLSASCALKKASVQVRPLHETPRLVLSGPYRLTRNPMYLGMILIAAAPVIVTSIWLDILPVVIFSIWINYTFVIREEKFLEKNFQVAYRIYESRVARWIGWPRIP